MTKQEQIEEMAKIMFGHICTRTKCDSCKYPNKQKDCEAYRNAEALYNAGYRKSDEIQLECENASLTVENEVLKRDVQNLERTLEEGREELKRVRKETAREIFSDLTKVFCPNFISKCHIECMAKKYGVEAEE